jgi:hypothetical protein
MQDGISGWMMAGLPLDQGASGGAGQRGFFSRLLG